jgi:hypothetical protein
VTIGAGVQLYGDQPDSLTDVDGHVWTFQAGQYCQGNTPNWWWGAVAIDGTQIFCGYAIAIRLMPDGHVWYEEAKQGGWYDATLTNEQGNLFNNNCCRVYVADPGPGVNEM